MAASVGNRIDADHLVIEAIFTLTLCNHGDFDRRVKRVFDTFPIKSVALCKEEPPVLRLSVSNALINPQPGVVFDNSTLEFIDCFRDDLQSIIDTDGTACPPFLCAATSALRDELPADTQPVESTNKVVQKEGKKQNKMTTRLVASRVTTIKAIRSEMRGLGHDDTAVVPCDVLKHLAQDCCSTFNSNRYRELWYDNSRFTDPDKPCPTPLVDAAPPPSVDVLVAQDVGLAAPAVGAPAPGGAEAHAPVDGAGDIMGAEDSAVWGRAMSLKWSWCWDKSFLSSKCESWIIWLGCLQRLLLLVSSFAS